MGYAAVAELVARAGDAARPACAGATATSTAVAHGHLFAAADALERAIELSVAGRADEIDVGDARRGTARRRRGQRRSRARRSAGAATRSREKNRAAIRGGRPRRVDGDCVVTLEANTPLPGVRAYLVLERARDARHRREHDDRRRARSRPTGSTGRSRSRSPPRQPTRRSTAWCVCRVRGRRAPNVAPVAAAAPTRRRRTANGADGRCGRRARPAARAVAAARHIRIDLRRLDTLMNLIGELVITRGRLQQLATTINDAGADRRP